MFFRLSVRRLHRIINAKRASGRFETVIYFCGLLSWSATQSLKHRQAVPQNARRTKQEWLVRPTRPNPDFYTHHAPFRGNYLQRISDKMKCSQVV